MKISVDSGALCGASKFGTHVVTHNILEALGRFDPNNSYTGYLYKRASHLPVFDNLKFKVLRPSFAWMSVRVSVEEMLYPKDIYLGLSQAIPWASKAQIIAFTHGLSFHFHKELYPDSYEALKDQVMFATSRANNFIVSSSKVQRELAEQFGFHNSIVLPFGVPFDMMTLGKTRKPSRPYFLFVGMDHAIKNVEYLIKAFTIFKEQRAHKDFELILVGNHEHRTDQKLGVRSLTADREMLRDLYRNATAYLTSSLYESYNLPVLEAMSQNVKVIGKTSAIIPEFKHYVGIADEVEDFVDLMKQATTEKKVESRDEVLQVFNWENYIMKLVKIYKP